MMNVFNFPKLPLFLAPVLILMGCPDDNNSASPTPDSGDATIGADASDGGTSTDASPDANNQDSATDDFVGYCRTVCAYESNCNSVSESSCMPVCVDFSARLNRTFVQTYAQCLADLTCTDAQDDCVVTAMTAATAAEDGAEADQGACDFRAANCGVEVDSVDWPDDLCDTVVALSTQARAAAVACLDRPCEETPTCLEDAGAFNY